MRRSAANVFDQMFIYHPSPWIERDWARISGLPLEDVWLTSEDGTQIHGWYVAAGERAPALLWCHGNAGNMINRLDNLARLHELGLTVLLFDYRGYGRSRGTPSETGFYQDARAAYAHVTDRRSVDPARLVVFGRSLGAAVAGALVAERPAAGLILESAFPSVAAVARNQLMGLPAHWLLQSRFPLIDRLKHVRVPLLMVHGDRDDIIPLRLGQQVFDAAHPPKSFYVVEGADHNNTYLVGGAAYFSRLKRFIWAVTNL
ncbi:alpha/beta hydrolase [Candidatus Nitrospira bockiana]